MKHLGLFEGIGGFSLAAKKMGWQTVAVCELAETPKQILRKRFPETIIHEDITTTDFTIYRERVDVLTGGFPCQNLSIATNAPIGIDEAKSGLWREMLRATREIQPTFIVIENSHLLLKRGFERLLFEFSELGYDAEWQCVQGFQVGIPQRRKRVYVILYPVGFGDRLPEGKICTGWDKSEYPAWRDSDPRIYGVAHGVSNRVDRHRALGNSLIPEIPLQIFKQINNATRRRI